MHPKQTTVPFNDIQATDIPCELFCQKNVKIISPSPPLYIRAGWRLKFQSKIFDFFQLLQIFKQ